MPSERQTRPLEDHPATPAGDPWLRTRRDYLRLAGTGRRWITRGVMVQYEPPQTRSGHPGESDPDARPARFGLTVSRKVGKAVVRNRAKRQLREIIRRTLRPLAKPGASYVLVARAGIDRQSYHTTERDLIWALGKLHADADLAGPKRSEPRRRGQRGRS